MQLMVAQQSISAESAPQGFAGVFKEPDEHAAGWSLSTRPWLRLTCVSCKTSRPGLPAVSAVLIAATCHASCEATALTLTRMSCVACGSEVG
jgi:hypothetical protein